MVGNRHFVVVDVYHDLKRSDVVESDAAFASVFGRGERVLQAAPLIPSQYCGEVRLACASGRHVASFRRNCLVGVPYGRRSVRVDRSGDQGEGEDLFVIPPSRSRVLKIKILLATVMNWSVGGE